jgi:type III restriction enzyme
MSAGMFDGWRWSACARKFFDEINRKYAPENVKYDVVKSFDKLMDLVK